MSYYFTEDHELFRSSLRDFFQREVAPNIDQWEEERKTPRHIWKQMGDMGFLGLGYPEEYGGSNLDFFYDVVFCEEISKLYSGGFAITQLVVQYMAGTYVMKHGSDVLKQKYLPGIISGDLICSIGISEPGAGSDVANIQTTATRVGDHYIVNGSKTFITNGVYGDFIVTVVKTDPKAGAAGVSLLVIDRNAEGVSARKLKKLGWHSSDTAELSFDEVKVPVENLVGHEGQGFYYLMGGLQLERLVAGISGYSGCESILQYSMQYMSERAAFGRPINKFQVLRHRVAQLASEIEATKQFVLHCCRMHNDGHYAVKESSMAKLLATELSDKCAYQCLQFFGGYGFMEEYKVARMFRDSRVGTIGAGTSEIMREIIAKMVIDDVSYKAAATPANRPAAPRPKPKPDARAASSQVRQSPASRGMNPPEAQADAPMQTSQMDMGRMLAGIQIKASSMDPLGNTLKLDMGGEQLFIDGKGDTNEVSLEDAAADCTVSLAPDDFQALMQGDLNPMTAFMSGKIKIKGDMGVAMKLQHLFS